MGKDRVPLLKDRIPPESAPAQPASRRRPDIAAGPGVLVDPKPTVRSA